MKRLGFAGLSSVLCLAFALPVMAQPQSPADIACNAKATKFYNETTKTLATFDDFVKDATCKDSMYRESSFTTFIGELVKTSKWKETLDLATRFSAEIPNAKAESKKYVLDNGLQAASALGDIDKILEWGEKVLAVDPNDLNALVIVTPTLPDKFPQLTDAAAKDKLLARAMELAKKILAMTKPGGLDDKTWQTAVIAPAHSVVGFVHLQKQENAEAAAEYDQVVKIIPKDQTSWYRQGLALTYIATAAQKLIAPAYDEINTPENRIPGPGRDAAVAKRDAIEADYVAKRDKAIDPFISAVALGGPIADSAGKTLDSLWEPAHNNSKEGLAEAIAKRKAELNK